LNASLKLCSAFSSLGSLVLGIVFGDLRVVAVMAAVIAVVGLYVFRERLHVSMTVVRVVLIALFIVLSLGSGSSSHLHLE
jgi:hypothetical protein